MDNASMETAWKKAEEFIARKRKASGCDGEHLDQNSRITILSATAALAGAVLIADAGKPKSLEG
jgi:hypothetical protein